MGITRTLSFTFALGFFGVAPTVTPGEEPPWKKLRDAMVRTQIAARDVGNFRVLDAMRTVPRHLFVPEAYRRKAYDDQPLPIGYDQTISQPYIVAIMTELLEPKAGDKVLEIGTGSGYQAAVLARLVGSVYTIEIVSPLAESARALLRDLGYTNVSVMTGDGYLGHPDAAPYDGIVVTAAPKEVPQPLIDQLKLGGRLVIPVGSFYQELMVLERTAKGVERKTLFPVRFVPMTGGPTKKSPS